MRSASAIKDSRLISDKKLGKLTMSLGLGLLHKTLSYTI